MIHKNNGCQGRRITEMTAARGDDPKTTAARGVDTSAGNVTGITVTVCDFLLVFSMHS